MLEFLGNSYVNILFKLNYEIVASWHECVIGNTVGPQNDNALSCNKNAWKGNQIPLDA